LRLIVIPFEDLKVRAATYRIQFAGYAHGLTGLPLPVLGVSVRHRKRGAGTMPYWRGTVPPPLGIEIVNIEIVANGCLTHVQKDGTLSGSQET
jgi:hypothetical protein